MGIVYVLVNRAMPDLVKIGKTEQTLELRMKGLDTTGVPLPFECYFAAEVKDNNEVEKKLHKTFIDKRVRDSREFFRVDPEQVKAALSLAAEKDVTPKSAIYTEVGDAEALEKESKKILEPTQKKSDIILLCKIFCNYSASSSYPSILFFK